MKTQLTFLGAALALSACNGPWNMQPETGPQPARLWVSHLLVADRPLDTLWLERPQALGQTGDSTAPFVDAAASQVSVVALETGVSYAFRPVPGLPAAWLAEDTAYRVQAGAEYALSATVRWNAAPGHPAAEDWRFHRLSARTRVPSVFALHPEMLVPVEALHPSLSVGLPKAVVQAALEDAAARNRLYDSLDALPAAPLAERGVSREDFAAYLRGEVTFLPVPRDGAIWYVFDAEQVVDPSGEKLHRYSLPYLFGQTVDKADFGGMILSQRFDPARARIYDPLSKGIDDALQRDLDSAEFYQAGDLRPLLVGGSYFPDLPMYPDTLRLTNLLWGYTGRNVLVAHSVDPLYFEYYKGSIQGGMDSDGGLGGGSTRAQNVLRYTNVENGDGYFSAAMADTFAFELRAVRDTIPVGALKAAFEKEKAKDGKMAE